MKYHLEAFTERVACKACDVDTNVLQEQSDNLGFDIAVILQLISVLAPIVIQLIDNCPNQKNLKNTIKNPNWLQKVRFRAQVTKALDSSGNTKFKYLSGKVSDAFFTESAKLTDMEIDNMLNENEVDNWLI